MAACCPGRPCKELAARVLVRLFSHKARQRDRERQRESAQDGERDREAEDACKHASMQACKHASMQACKHACIVNYLL